MIVTVSAFFLYGGVGLLPAAIGLTAVFPQAPEYLARQVESPPTTLSFRLGKRARPALEYVANR